MAAYSHGGGLVHPTQAQYPQHVIPEHSNHDSTRNDDDQTSLGNLEFLKSLATEKKQTRDGQPAKRRGPKPDSKPALTRRQELNRQAQRTHRERKEMYIKALEEQVGRLKDIYAETARERNLIAEENRRLKQLLTQHGISYSLEGNGIKLNRDAAAASPHITSSSGSFSGSYRNTSDTTGLSPPDHNLANVSFHTPPTPHDHGMVQPSNTNLDYVQIGMDFVLTYDSQGRPIHHHAPYPSPPPQLERPCMEHMQYLMVRSQNPAGKTFHHPMENADDGAHAHMSGHALMASGPPHAHVLTRPGEPYPHQLPADLDDASLAKLLDLSARLPIDREGEITPIMAWSTITHCDRLAHLDAADFERIKLNLSDKVRCYGFGAVLEEFEVRDALLSVLEEKDLAPAMPHAIAV